MLDYCVKPRSVVNSVTDFDTLHDLSLPPDHAPIIISLPQPSENLSSLYNRTGILGDNALLHSNVKSPFSDDLFNVSL